MPISTNTPLDFGYPWWLGYGHLVILIPALSIFLLAHARQWSTWLRLVLGALVLWSAAAFVVMRFVIDINGRPSLPTQSFFRSGQGRVLDIGAGTGRSSIMVLLARPQATLVALDLFGDSFRRHFGPGDSPQQKLLANLKAAGVEQRSTIEIADMRKLPFEGGTFDAIVSAYAIDHLNREGISQALSEAARVGKPGGDFLLILVANDAWGKFAFGPALAHGGLRGLEWWAGKLQEAGFQVLERGTQPLTIYLLARRS